MQPNRPKSRRFHRKAFTLIEVMLVLVILIVLAGISVTMIQSSRETARKNEAMIYVKSMDTPLGLFQMDHGRFPYTSEGLDALINPPPDVDQSKGTWPYISASAVKTDPWGQPYQYMFPGQRSPTSYDLWSLGPDGAPDTGDEIGNWCFFWSGVVRKLHAGSVPTSRYTPEREQKENLTFFVLHAGETPAIPGLCSFLGNLPEIRPLILWLVSCTVCGHYKGYSGLRLNNREPNIHA